MPRHKLARMFLVFLTAVYLGLCAVVFHFQRSFIYHPTPDLPAQVGTTESLAVDGANLKVSVREVKGKQALIYFGGNAETVSQSLPKYVAAFPSHAIYMLHYRGFSGSTSEPSEDALQQDAAKLYQLVSAKYQHLTVIGRSLGSGLAVWLAANHKVDKLMLITPYDSMVNMAKLKFPYLPVRWMLQDKFESSSHAAKVSVPTLIVVADADQVIPSANSKALLASFNPGIASIKVIYNSDHHNISTQPTYFPLLTSF